jgi:hypothetical protein
MAIRDNHSIKLTRASLDLPRYNRVSRATEHTSVELEIRGKWHPRATLLFILISCGLSWAGIFPLITYLR